MLVVTVHDDNTYSLCGYGYCSKSNNSLYLNFKNTEQTNWFHFVTQEVVLLASSVAKRQYVLNCSRKKWQIKSGDAGTIDQFNLAFQYKIFFLLKEWTKTIKNKKILQNA